MSLEIVILMNMSERAVQGMTDLQFVQRHEDAASDIVAHWESEDGGLLNSRDAERFAELGGTVEDMNEIRGRSIDLVKNAIRRMREAS